METLRSLFDPAGIEEKIKEQQELMLKEGFWDNPKESAEVQRQSKALQDKINTIRKIEDLFENVELSCELFEMGETDQKKEGEQIFHELESLVEELEVETLLHGDYDANNAILRIQAGTGGLDAQDWSEMMMRMYMRYCDKEDFKVSILDILHDTEAGIKHVELEVLGDYAFGKLKGERGVHRLVRISPYNSSGKRQTSFASVEVMPEIDDDVEVNIRPEDLKVDTYRSGGAGGQHVNVTDSAVRITHLPTGIVVQCQNERSQLSNKESAMKVLRSRLYELEMKKKEAELQGIKGDSLENTWGSQIRSYVLHPYNLVKDHRTGEETGNVTAVLDGELAAFTKAYLKEFS